MRTAFFWAITQRVVVIPYRRFGTTYRYYLQRSRIQEESPLPFLDFLPLKMGPVGCPETSVMDYHYSLRNSPEERGSQPIYELQAQYKHNNSSNNNNNNNNTGKVPVHAVEMYVG